MDRRELLQLLSATSALAFLPPDLLPAARALHAARGPRQALDADQAALVTLIGDMILPRTDTPAASDVDTTGFVDRLLADWYPDDERRRFLAGLAHLEARAVDLHGGRFVTLPEPARVELLTGFDTSTGELDTAAGAFRRLKGLVIYGWFTSEAVMQLDTAHPMIPGRFDGCIPLHRP